MHAIPSRFSHVAQVSDILHFSVCVCSLSFLSDTQGCMPGSPEINPIFLQFHTSSEYACSYPFLDLYNDFIGLYAQNHDC